MAKYRKKTVFLFNKSKYNPETRTNYFNMNIINFLLLINLIEIGLIVYLLSKKYETKNLADAFRKKKKKKRVLFKEERAESRASK